LDRMAGREDPVELCISQAFWRRLRGGGSGEPYGASERPTRGGRPQSPKGVLSLSRGARLVRCLAGAARLRDYSEGAQWSAQRGGKPRVERKGKCRLECVPKHGTHARKRGLAILGRSERRPRCRKSYRGDNWLVAVESSYRRGFLILRCWLFPPCCRRRRQG